MSRKMRLKISSRLLKKKFKKQGSSSPRRCRFENDAEMAKEINYKNTRFLEGFLTESKKILSSRVSGNSAFYQRILTRHIKLARSMALLPYCTWSK